MKCIPKELCRIGQVIDAILFNFYIKAATLAALSLLMVTPPLMADQVEANLIQITDTSNFPAPDPAGIAYLPSQDAFLISDSEINEMNIFQGSNVFKVDRHGSLLETFSTIPFSSEPTGVTINPVNHHCFFSDDNRRKIYEIDPGKDGHCLTADDKVTSFATDTLFGSGDPEDVTYGLNSLFIIDGNNNRVYRISGNNGVFNNVTKNNLVNSFDTQSLGVTDPEGIVFDSTNDTLFIVGRREKSIIQTTIYGILLNTINISTINANNPASLALAPSSEDPTKTNLYMVARGVDNNDDPNENDGMIYELQIPSFMQGNARPVVAAGGDQSITLPANAQLNGSVSDDGLPDGTLTATWSKQSGPGAISFTNANNVNTIASFSTAGTYVLRLTGDDGELYSFDDLSIVVSSNGTSENTVVQSRVSAGADDAKERAGSVYLNSKDLELVFDNNYLQIIGLRFSALTIPANAIITKAYIQFEADETDFLLDTHLNIVAEKNNNAATFSSAAYNISSRSKTNASVSWSPAAWDTIGAAGEDQRSSDLTAIVQEIISETAWNSGNAMAFIFTGSGRRVAVSYEGDRAGAPLLHVEYSSE